MATRPSSPIFVENPGPADYLRAARDGLARRDFALAFEQVGAALSFDPTSREALSLLERIAAVAPPGAGHVQDGSDPFFGAAAVHAWLLARSGDVQEALLVLFDVVQYRPEVPYLAWAPGWVRGKGGAHLRWDEIGPAVEAFYLRARDAAVRGEVDRQRGNVDGAMAVLAAVRERAADEGRARATALRAAFLVLRGEPDEALRELRSEKKARGAHALLSLEEARLLRARGDRDGEVASLREAVSLAPGGLEARVRLGEALVDRADFEGAIDALAGVSGDGREHPAAAAALVAARWLAGPDPALLGELSRLARRGVDEGYALRLGRELGELDTVLSSPADDVSRAVADALGKLARRDPASKVEIRIRTERPGPPSAQVAMRLGTAWRGAPAELRFEGPSGAAHRLWRPVPGGWEPAVPPPGARVADAVGALARTAFEDAAWAEAAASLARAWSAEERAELPGALAHPGPVPDDWHPVRWVFAAQVAAAYCLAAGDDPWEGSARRACLFEIARGPDDATVAAAVIALGRVARSDPAARPEIEALFAELLLARSEGDDSPSEMPLLAAWWRVAGPNSDQGRTLWQRLRRCRARLALSISEASGGGVS